MSLAKLSEILDKIDDALAAGRPHEATNVLMDAKMLVLDMQIAERTQVALSDPRIKWVET